MSRSAMPGSLPATKGTRLAAMLKTVAALTQEDLSLLQCIASTDGWVDTDLARCACQAAQLSVALQEGLIARRGGAS